ncbi:cupin domain-containing protein [Conexibacter woesei]|uniref:Cupin 2 conserved barrel domain protein n=1 Tax=Conexibacter woesei (strain DSM 14684 / CCUG 47730 / CIP 108061 / JCM 11494 / NBRC 100937 / ID131577) TaxID=469383 RepID=D3F9P2_CONWI|nr:cupin domain-containing protein [Conexibacter woesei]ADB51104.1 Cupin 2 conserved barrel domain protein [Conexibacter woesei DSM 14684]
MSTTPRRVRAVLLLVAALVLSAAAGAYATTVLRAAADAPVVRTALAEARDPAGAPGRTLGLSRVTVDPGAQLALHRHPGVQIATIARGTLSYWVVRGSVTVRRGDPDAPGGARVVRTIGAGEKGKVRTGDWIVENPGTIHRAANEGRVEIEILISSLFKDGEPPAIPVRP